MHSLRLHCPNCRRQLNAALRCICGFRGRRVDGIPLLLQDGQPAVWNDSDSLFARAGRTWKSQLAKEGEKAFVARLLDTPRRPDQGPLLTAGQLRHARRLSRWQRLRRESPPDHEPDAPIKWIVDTASRLPLRSLLDIGSGGGFLLSSLSRRLRGTTLVGIDRDFLCLRVASRRVALGGGRCLMLGADARLLPFADSTFDCATSNFAIWHMEGFDQVLSEVHRVLKPGGSFISCEMGHNFLVWWLSRNSNSKLAKAFGLYPSTADLVRKLESLGFRSSHYVPRRAGQIVWREMHFVRGR